MPNCIYYKKNRERWLICPMNCLISLSLSCSMFFYPKMGELQDMRDYINMLVLDTDMARYNATHPMHESAWVFQKLWGIGCPNKWDMRILQVFFFCKGIFYFSWNMKMIVNQKNEIKFDFEYLVRFWVTVRLILDVSTHEIR